MKRKANSTKNRLDDAILEMATALYDVKAIDGITMREFDSLNIPEAKPLSAKQIKMIRLKEKVSQAIFAKFLNISRETIRKWEQGERYPTGTSLRLLNLISNKGLMALIE